MKSLFATAAAALALAASASVQAQPAFVLEPDRNTALRTCMAGAAVLVDPEDAEATALTVGDALWYSLELARNLPGEEALQGVQRNFERLDKDRIGEMFRLRQGAAVAAACAERFPANRREAPVQLPEDRFKRDLLCLSTSSLLSGIYERAPDALAIATRVIEQHAARVDRAAYRRNGLTTDNAIARAFGASLIAAHDAGNLNSVLLACDKAV